MKDRAWIEIDLDALDNNVKILTQTMSHRSKMMAVVKADAYGHGAKIVAAHLEKIGVTAFAVATIDEGISLRSSGIRSEILILGYTDPIRIQELYDHDLTQTLVSPDHAKALARNDLPIKAHMKIDTGMHRLGFDWKDIQAIRDCFTLPGLKLTGIYSHLCVSDSLSARDQEFSLIQTQRFTRLLKKLCAEGVPLPKAHIQSSYGLLNHPQIKCDYVRIGIALYGVHSSSGLRTILRPKLRPVLSLRSKVVLTRQIAKGETIGYGRTFATARNTTIAVISIGYADGLPRSLSNTSSYVLINGHPAPIIGRICMDQLTVDITDIPNVTPGTTVTLIGKDADRSIRAEEMAKQAGTITNELLSRLGERLEVYPNSQ